LKLFPYSTKIFLNFLDKICPINQFIEVFLMIKISKKILKTVGQTNGKYGLIGEGDRVLVGLSGGKDSLTLIHALKNMQRKAPFNFEFEAITVAYGMGENLEYVIQHCKEYDIKHRVVDTNIFEISKDKIRKNSSFCSFFSRMRRGALYSYALKEGFNKLALAHHLDDAVESFFMNMFYNGALRTMPPIYRATNGLLVIRPLIMTRERQLEAFAIENNLQTISDEACPAMRFDVKMPHARANTKEFVKELEEKKGDIMKIIKASFENISDETFFDKGRFKLNEK
jgi:tRNA(Ile)-lysidine synthetase-like protein